MYGNDTWQSLGAMIVLVYVTIMQYIIEFKTLLALLKAVLLHEWLCRSIGSLNYGRIIKLSSKLMVHPIFLNEMDTNNVIWFDPLLWR